MAKLINLAVEKLDDYDNHKLVILLNDDKSGLKGFITIHRGADERPAFGATRYWNYKSDLDALVDSLKLSKIMSYKSALAGLKYGGAKAVIRNSLLNKPLLLRTYAKYINSLGGKFITGSDVGIDDKDLKILASESDFIVGQKSDPAGFTAQGVLYSIQTALNEAFGKPNIAGRSFAIQGVGKTGYQLLSLLYVQAKKVYVADVDKEKLKRVKNKFPKTEILPPSEIYTQKVDVFTPCALSNSINTDNVNSLRCSIITGSANNQLEDILIGKELQKRNILYTPDYVANAGGLIAVVDEYEHKNFDQERVENRLQKIQKTLKDIFHEHKRTRKPTNVIANKMAEKIFNKLR